MLLLAHIEYNQRTNNQNFWSIYFVDPLGTNTSFVIDNKTPDTQTFHYDILVNDNSVQSGNMEIKNGGRKLIELNKQDITSTLKIIVTNGGNKKQIERN